MPRTVGGVDFLVSMPKLKTHHWAGVTLSLKNTFGVVPDSCYGWPKSALDWAGIDCAILDTNAAAGTMRWRTAYWHGGNGPIQRTPKPCGVLFLGG